MVALCCRLSSAALGGELCDGNCHDQLRNTVTVHIRSRHIDSVSGQNLERFGKISGYPDALQSPAYYHYALAEVRNTFWSAASNLTPHTYVFTIVQSSFGCKYCPVHVTYAELRPHTILYTCIKPICM